MIDKSIEDSIAYVLSQDINYGDSESFLTFNQERYPEYNNPEDDKITADLSGLYIAMNGTSLKEVDKIICVVFDICRDYERHGFTTEIKFVMRHTQKLNPVKRRIC